MSSTPRSSMLLPIHSLPSGGGLDGFRRERRSSSRIAHQLAGYLVYLAVGSLTCCGLYSTLTAFPLSLNYFPPLPAHGNIINTAQDSLRASLSKAFTIATPPVHQLPSTRWAPVSLTTCEDETPSYYAPCLATRKAGAVLGEELIYPDFSLREPHWTGVRKDLDQERWRKIIDGIRERGYNKNNGWVAYRGQHGQNLV